MDGKDRLLAVEDATRRHLAARPAVAAAFLAGSVVEGYGNPTSDIDVLVLADGEGDTVPAPEGGRPVFRFEDCTVEIVHAGDERLDIETRPLPEFRRIVSRLHALPVDQEGAYEVSAFTFQFLHQLRVGRPVVGHELIAELRAAVDWGRVGELLRIRRQSDYGGHAEDAAGAIRAEDAGTALLTSRLALGTAMDCLIAALGHTNPKEKWRYRKLADLGRHDVASRCLALECDPDPDPRALLRSARRRLVAAQELVAEAGRLGRQPVGG